MQTEIAPEIESDISVDLEIILSWEADHCQSGHSDIGNYICTHQVVATISGCDTSHPAKVCQAHVAAKVAYMESGGRCSRCKGPAADCWTITYI